MKIIKAKQPGFEIKLLADMLSGARYPVGDGREPLLSAGIVIACGIETPSAMAAVLRSMELSVIAISCGRITLQQWSGLTGALCAKSAKLLSTTIALEGLEDSPQWLVESLVAFCDGQRPFQLILATTDNYQAVAEPLRDRFLGYLGLSADGYMKFALPPLISIDKGSLRRGDEHKSN